MPDPVTVLHVVNSLEYGGAETYLMHLLPRLVQRGYNVHLAYLVGNGTLRPRFEAGGVRVHSIGINAKYQLPVAVWRANELMRTVGCRIVHTHLVHAALVGRCASLFHRPAALIHSEYHAFHPKCRTFLYQCERWTKGLADRVFAPSDAVVQHLKRLAPAARVLRLRLGIPIDDFESSHGAQHETELSPYLLAIGHFRDGQKGHDVFLRAFAQTRRELPELRAVIVGDGQLRDWARQLSVQLGIGDAVTFAGIRGDIAALLAGCRLFVLASRWEGFGMVLVEAMASGACVVGTTAEAIPELVRDGVTGVIVPKDDPTALADAIVALLQDDARLRSYREAARQCARAYDIDDIADEMSDVYKSVLRETERRTCA